MKQIFTSFYTEEKIIHSSVENESIVIGLLEGIILYFEISNIFSENELNLVP